MKYFIFAILVVVAQSLFSATGDYVWTGNGSANKWSYTSNWKVEQSDGSYSAATYLPATSSNVTIPASPDGGVYPDINHETYCRCNKLKIESGAVLYGTYSVGILRVYGSLTAADNSIDITAAKVIFKLGTSNKYINAGADYSYTLNFYDVDIESDDGIRKLVVHPGISGTRKLEIANDLHLVSGLLNIGQANIDVDGDLTIDKSLNFADGVPRTLIVGGDVLGNSSGVINAYNSTIKIAGNMSMSGTFNQSTSTVIFSGSLNSTLPSRTFYNLKLEKTADSYTVTPSGNITVENVLTVTSGKLDCGSNNLTLTGAGDDAIINGVLEFSSSAPSKKSRGAVFDIQDGDLAGSGTINAGAATIEIDESMTFTGTFNGGTSTVLFDESDGYPSIATVSGDGFYNIEVDGPTELRPNASTINIMNDLIFTTGSLNKGTSTIVFVGDEDSQFSSSINFYNLTIDKAESKLKTVSPLGKFTVNNSLLISEGELDISTHDVNVINGGVTVNGRLSAAVSGAGTFNLTGGDLSGGGTINAGSLYFKMTKNMTFTGTLNAQTSRFMFYGTDQASIAPSLSFYNLSFYKTSNSTEITCSGIISFTNDLAYDQGYFRGGLRTVKTASSLNISNYLYYGNKATSSNSVTFTKYSGSLPPGGTDNALKNYLVVSSSDNIGDIRVAYNQSKELNGNPSGDDVLAAWKSTNGGVAWDKYAGTTYNTNSKYGKIYGAYTGGTTTYMTATDKTNTSLPVEFDEELFTGEYKNGVVELKWLTHSETGLRGFIVYRSENLNSNFEQIDSWEDNLTLVSKHDENGGFTTNDTEYVYNDNSVEEGKVYYYRISAYCSDTDNEYHPKTVKVETSALDSDEPEGMFLEQNYPNPFNAATNISYAVSKETMVSLVLYNSNGQIAKVLVDNVKAPGHYSVVVSNSDISTGVYYYVMKAGGYKGIKKMIVVK